MNETHELEFYDHELDEDQRRQLMAILLTKQEDPDTEIPIPMDSPLGRLIKSKSE